MTEMDIAPADSKRFGKFSLFLTLLYIHWALILIGTVSIFADSYDAGAIFLALGMIIGLLVLIFGCIIFFRLWKFAIYESKLSGLAPSISSPGRALGFGFIPLFNFYWVFIAWGKLPRDLNALAESRKCRQRLSQGMGNTIPILSVLSIIPWVGYVLGFVGGCILIPLFFRNAIRLCREIDQTTPDGDASSSNIPDPEAPVPSIDLASISSFSELFHHPNRKFNFLLVAILSFTSLMLMVSVMIFLFRWNPISYLIYRKISLLLSVGFYVVFWFGFVGLCSLVSRNWVLPFAWALLSLGIRAGWGFIFGTGIFSEGSGITVVIWPFPENIVDLSYDFTRSICFVAGPLLAIRLWRVKIWSLIAGMAGGFLMLHIVEFFVGVVVYGNFSIAWILKTLPLMCYWVVYGVALYAGFHFHFRRFSRKWDHTG